MAERDKTSFRMGGVTYLDVFLFKTTWPTTNVSAEYNLNGQYERLTGMLGHLDGTGTGNLNNLILEVCHDGIFYE